MDLIAKALEESDKMVEEALHAVNPPSPPSSRPEIGTAVMPRSGKDGSGGGDRGGKGYIGLVPEKTMEEYRRIAVDTEASKIGRKEGDEIGDEGREEESGEGEGVGEVGRERTKGDKDGGSEKVSWEDVSGVSKVKARKAAVGDLASERRRLQKRAETLLKRYQGAEDILSRKKDPVKEEGSVSAWGSDKVEEEGEEKEEFGVVGAVVPSSSSRPPSTTSTQQPPSTRSSSRGRRRRGKRSSGVGRGRGGRGRERGRGRGRGRGGGGRDRGRGGGRGGENVADEIEKLRAEAIAQRQRLQQLHGAPVDLFRSPLIPSSEPGKPGKVEEDLEEQVAGVEEIGSSGGRGGVVDFSAPMSSSHPRPPHPTASPHPTPSPSLPPPSSSPSSPPSSPPSSSSSSRDVGKAEQELLGRLRRLAALERETVAAAAFDRIRRRRLCGMLRGWRGVVVRLQRGRQLAARLGDRSWRRRALVRGVWGEWRTMVVRRRLQRTAAMRYAKERVGRMAFGQWKQVARLLQVRREAMAAEAAVKRARRAWTMAVQHNHAQTLSKAFCAWKFAIPILHKEALHRAAHAARASRMKQQFIRSKVPHPTTTHSVQESEQEQEEEEEEEEEEEGEEEEEEEKGEWEEDVSSQLPPHSPRSSPPVTKPSLLPPSPSSPVSESPVNPWSMSPQRVIPSPPSILRHPVTSSPHRRSNPSTPPRSFALDMGIGEEGGGDDSAAAALFPIVAAPPKPPAKKVKSKRRSSLSRRSKPKSKKATTPTKSRIPISRRRTTKPKGKGEEKEGVVGRGEREEDVAILSPSRRCGAVPSPFAPHPREVFANVPSMAGGEASSPARPVYVTREPQPPVVASPPVRIRIDKELTEVGFGGVKDGEEVEGEVEEKKTMVETRKTKKKKKVSSLQLREMEKKRRRRRERLKKEADEARKRAEEKRRELREKQEEVDRRRRERYEGEGVTEGAEEKGETSPTGGGGEEGFGGSDTPKSTLPKSTRHSPRRSMRMDDSDTWKIGNEVRLLRYWGFLPWMRFWKLRRGDGEELEKKVKVELEVRKKKRLLELWRKRMVQVRVERERRVVEMGEECLSRRVFARWLQLTMYRKRKLAVLSTRIRFKQLSSTFHFWRAQGFVLRAQRIATEQRRKEQQLAAALRLGKRARLARVFGAWNVEARAALRSEKERVVRRERLRKLAKGTLQQFE